MDSNNHESSVSPGVIRFFEEPTVSQFWECGNYPYFLVQAYFDVYCSRILHDCEHRIVYATEFRDINEDPYYPPYIYISEIYTDCGFTKNVPPRVGAMVDGPTEAQLKSGNYVPPCLQCRSQCVPTLFKLVVKKIFVDFLSQVAYDYSCLRHCDKSVDSYNSDIDADENYDDDDDDDENCILKRKISQRQLANVDYFLELVSTLSGVKAIIPKMLLSCVMSLRKVLVNIRNRHLFRLKLSEYMMNDFLNEYMLLAFCVKAHTGPHATTDRVVKDPVLPANEPAPNEQCEATVPEIAPSVMINYQNGWLKFDFDRHV